jgi:hypothetical protein
VQGAKGEAHQFHVVAALVQFQQCSLEIDQDLARFFPEGMAKLISAGL